jgi:hypothetical protein
VIGSRSRQPFGAIRFAREVQVNARTNVSLQKFFVYLFIYFYRFRRDVSSEWVPAVFVFRSASQQLLLRCGGFIIISLCSDTHCVRFCYYYAQVTARQVFYIFLKSVPSTPRTEPMVVVTNVDLFSRRGRGSLIPPPPEGKLRLRFKVGSHDDSHSCDSRDNSARADLVIVR